MRKTDAFKACLATAALLLLATVTAFADKTQNKLEVNVISMQGEGQSQVGMPGGIEATANGVLFTDNTNGVIYKFDNNKLKLFAGVQMSTQSSVKQGGYVDAVTELARFSAPQGILSIENKVYVADSDNNSVRVVAGNTVSTYSGGLKKGWRDGDRRSALYNNPTALCKDDAGNIYVADTGNSCIRKISAKGEVTTVAGVSGNAGFKDGSTDAALLYSPVDVKYYEDTLYIADSGNKALRALKDDKLSTVICAPNNDNQVIKGIINTANSDIGEISCVAINENGILYVGDSTNSKIYKIENSKLSVFLDKDTQVNEGELTAYQYIKSPVSLCVNESELFVADSTSGYVVGIKIPQQ